MLFPTEILVVFSLISLISSSLRLFCNSIGFLDDREIVVLSAYIVTLPLCNAHGKSFILIRNSKNLTVVPRLFQSWAPRYANSFCPRPTLIMAT